MSCHGTPRRQFQRKDQPQRHDRCDRCGLTNHAKEDCRYKNATCYKCNKVGHLQSECRSTDARNKREPRRQPHKQKKMHYVEDNDEQPSEFVDSVYDIHEYSRSIKVPVRIGNVSIQMELDTRASVSVMNSVDYEKHFKDQELKPTKAIYMLTLVLR